MDLVPFRFISGMQKSRSIRRTSIRRSRKGNRLWERSIKIQEQLRTTDGDNEELIGSPNRLTSCCLLVRKLDEAESTALRSVALTEQVYGQSHWSLKNRLTQLADILKASGKGEEAEQVNERKKGISNPTPKELEENRLRIMYGSSSL